MKKLALFALIALLSACPAAFAGSNQLELNANWFSDGTTRDLGKVIYNQPAGKNKIDLTYILQNAAPNTTYTVGFDIVVPACTVPPLTFGVAQWGCQGNYGNTITAIFIAGTATTDSDGDGSFHINLLNLPPGDYPITFWVSPGEGTLNPSAATTSLYNSADLPSIHIK